MIRAGGYWSSKYSGPSSTVGRAGELAMAIDDRTSGSEIVWERRKQGWPGKRAGRARLSNRYANQIRLF